MHDSCNAMHSAFDIMGADENFIADYLNKSVSDIRSLLNGQKFPTLRLLSYMATAMDCKLVIEFKQLKKIRSKRADKAVNKNVNKPTDKKL